MGVIMTIRNKFGYAVIGLIALAIIGFLVMDTTNQQTGIFGNNAVNAGSINGEDVPLQEYQTKVNETEENFKLNSPDAPITDETRYMLLEETWNTYIKEKLMTKEFEKLGITVSKDEVYEMLQGSNPHPMVVQSFTNPQTGQFDPTGVSRFISTLDESTAEMSSDEKRRRWLNFEKFIKEDRRDSKYYTLIKKSLLVPDWEAKKMHELQGSQVDVDYVYLPFIDITDESVKITDSDLKDYLNRHQAQYKQEPSRVIDYVTFSLLPSGKDTVNTEKWINEQTEKFKVAKSDSLFIKLYSEQGYNTKYLTKDQLTSSIADTFFSIAPGTFVGPYIDNGSYVVAKLIGRKGIPDSVRAQQIVLTVRSQEEVMSKKAYADSITELIKNGADIAMFLDSSADMESRMKGGDMGYIKPGTQFQTIDQALFNDYGQGDVFMVPSDKGFHIIKITEAKPGKTGVKVAFLSKKIAPSSETKDLLYADANKFASTYSSGKAFKDAGKEKSIKTSESLLPGSYSIAGLGASRELVKWAFNAKEGEVSKVFRLNDKYVVAHLSALREGGVASIDNVRAELEQEVRKEKKAKMLLDKIEGAKDLQTAASKSGKQVKNAAQLSFNNALIEGALEPKVPSAAMGLKAGETSLPVTGNTGVFVLQLKNITPAGPLENLDATKQQLSFTHQQRVQGDVFKALKDASEIEDLRYKYDNF